MQAWAQLERGHQNAWNHTCILHFFSKICLSHNLVGSASVSHEYNNVILRRCSGSHMTETHWVVGWWCYEYEYCNTNIVCNEWSDRAGVFGDDDEMSRVQFYQSSPTFHRHKAYTRGPEPYVAGNGHAQYLLPSGIFQPVLHASCILIKP